MCDKTMQWKLGCNGDIEQFPTWFLATLDVKLYLASSITAEPM